MNAVARPVGVTLVGILVILIGIVSVLGAIIGLFSADMRVGATLVTLVFLLVIGLIYIAVAKGIFDGNSFSRFLVALVTVIGLCIGLFHLIFVSGLRWNGFVTVIVDIVILALLFSRKASMFFASR